MSIFKYLINSFNNLYIKDSFTALVIGTEKPIKIGVILTTNEHYADIIQKIKTDIQRSVDLINADTLDGIEFEIIYENDQDNLSAAKEIATKMISNGVKIIAPISWKTFVELYPISENNGVLLFFPTTSGHIYDTGKYTFRDRDFIIGPTLTMADVARNKLNLSDVFVFYSDYPDDKRGKMSKDLFKTRFEDLGGKVSREVPFASPEDFSNYVDEIKNSESKAILFTGVGRATTQIISMIVLAEQYNLNQTILLSGPNIDKLPESTKLSSISRKVIFISYPTLANPKRKEVYSKYAREDNETSIFFKEIFGMMDILTQAIKNCKGDDTECLQKELHENEFNSIFGKVRFSSNGLIIRPFMIATIEGGVSINLYEYSIVDSDMSKYYDMVKSEIPML